MDRTREEDMGRLLVEYLRADGWIVYQEVKCSRYSGPRADIVADRNGELHVVEVKTCFSSRLINQARSWQTWAEYTSIAIPYPTHISGSKARRICDVISIGLGVFYISDRVQVAVMPRKMEGTRSEWLRECLREEQKYYAPAGNNRSDFVSGFRLTCDALRHVVENEPGFRLSPE